MDAYGGGFGVVSTTTNAMREEARRLAVSSCREQGLDPKVTDPVVLGKLAALLGSELPDGGDAGRVEAVATAHCGVDRDVLDQGPEDGPPATERKVAPSAA